MHYESHRTYPVAAALHFEGRLDWNEVSAETIRDENVLQAGITNAPWQPEAPPSDEELIKKYNLLANDRVNAEQTEEMRGDVAITFGQSYFRITAPETRC